MITLGSPIGDLGRLGKIMSRRLKKIGLETCGDLLFYFPFRYEDLSRLVPVFQLELGVIATVRGRIEQIKSFRSPIKRMIVTEAILSDDTGQIKAIWFNQPYLTKVLRTGLEVYLAGKVENPYYTKQITNPSYELVRPSADGPTHTARIVPVYSVTSDISQKQLRILVKDVMPLAYQVQEYLPSDLLTRYSFPDLREALLAIHFPETLPHGLKARERFEFDEFFLLQLQLQQLKRFSKQLAAPAIEFKEAQTKEFVTSLPFTLTDDQRKVAWEIIKDMAAGIPMNRLVQGDVGSGKTVTAAIAIYNVALNDFQSVIMAPTEILAGQHFITLSRVLPSLKIALFTRAQHILFENGTKIEFTKTKLIKLIESGGADLIIGTHALIQDDFKCRNIALCVIDEQHRFGVAQRKALTQKSGLPEGLTPHLCSMTATPIPRTLALAWYSDLDLSEIKQMPKGRKKIITQIVLDNQRAQTYEFVRAQIKEGRQVYVICPLIDLSDKLGVKAVTKEVETLRKIFPEFKIALLHGRLKSQEKDAVMAAFKAGETHILVSTSVIEVGVDVANATVMVIEGAERFGLSQLHQIRGRVGRSDQQSYCYLLPTEASPHSLNRLRALVDSQDGFELSQRDLELRGPGEMYGTMQSGIPELKLADFTNYGLTKKAQDEARAILETDITLENYPSLKSKIEEMNQRIHLE